MDRKLALLGASIGSIVGGYIPSLFHASAFSIWGIITAAIGGFAGLWLAWRFGG